MTSVFNARGNMDTDNTQGTRCHAKKKAEIGVTLPHVKGPKTASNHPRI